MHKSTLDRHCKAKHNTQSGGIPEAFQAQQKKKEELFSDDDRKEIHHQTAIFIAACGMPLSTFEKPAAKKYMEFLMEKTGNYYKFSV